MKPTFVVAAFCVLLAFQASAQTDTSVALPVPSDAPADSAGALASVPHRSLLPERTSFMERTMWGESGILRGLGIASPLTPEVRKSELQLRRTMLSLHQISGFVTLGLMGTTVYFGQRAIDGKENKDRHAAFATAAIISYGCTAALSILAPPPLIRRDEVSTTTLHKTLAWVHFAGMIVTPILAGMISRNADFDKRAHIHQVSGYITTATLTLSMIVMTF